MTRGSTIVPALIFALIAFALAVPWNMFITYLAATNSQLSDSALVRLVPFFFMIVVYGVWQGRRKRRQG